MKLHWGKHTCAIGTHVLLEEIGAPYGTREWNVEGGDTRRPPFTDINPKGKVPVLERDDGGVITEYGAIATWLARRYPEKKLLPADAEGEMRVLEATDHTVGTIHAQGFGRLFMPQRFEPDDVLHGTLGLGSSAVRKQGREIAERDFVILANGFGDGPWFAGGQFTIADSALFNVERWAAQEHVPLPPKLDAHLARTKQRPAVARVPATWGES